MHAVSYTNYNLQIKNHTIPKNYVSLRRTTQYPCNTRIGKVDDKAPSNKKLYVNPDLQCTLVIKSTAEMRKWRYGSVAHAIIFVFDKIHLTV